MATRRGGFFAGLTAGLALGALAALALALAFPLATAPPELDATTSAAPEAPAAPAAAPGTPVPPAPGGLIRTEAPGPLLDVPAPERDDDNRGPSLFPAR